MGKHYQILIRSVSVFMCDKYIGLVLNRSAVAYVHIETL